MKILPGFDGFGIKLNQTVKKMKLASQDFFFQKLTVLFEQNKNANVFLKI